MPKKSLEIKAPENFSNQSEQGGTYSREAFLQILPTGPYLLPRPRQALFLQTSFQVHEYVLIFLPLAIEQITQFFLVD